MMHISKLFDTIKPASLNELKVELHEFSSVKIDECIVIQKKMENYTIGKK